MLTSNGVIYIATDSMRYVEMAARSAQAARKYLGGPRATLYTDQPLNSLFREFDTIEVISNLTPGGRTTQDYCEGPAYFEAKIQILGRSLYSRNLYLDCDVMAEAPADIFGLLERFDIAVAHAPRRLSRWSRDLKIPESFPDFNVGLFLYRAGLDDFFTRWLRNYRECPQPHDQTSFRKTVWETGVRVATLPPEYNRRPDHLAAGQELRIRHG